MIIETLGASAIGAVLYRLRGGWWKALTGGGRWWNGSQACRAIWAVPTAVLVFWLAGGPWWLLPTLAVSVFLSMALIGHGAHMIFDTGLMFDIEKSKTELLTAFWLPRLFGGEPRPGWHPDDVTLYNLVGMSAIGVVRNALALGPIAYFAPLTVIAYSAAGALHGPLYWAGWRIRGGGIQAAELLVGGVSWATIVLLFGDM